MQPKRVCLVSPGHVASNPRLVKEADSLHMAGYQVRVVAGDYMDVVRPLDQTILAQAPWSYVLVGLGARWEYIGRRIRQKVARSLAKLGWMSHPALAIWAHYPLSYRLASVAMSEPADLYIAHCLAALPAAAIAAKHHQARLGFDAEDFHVGELADTPENQPEIRVRDCIERTFLSQCQHLTAASPLIASAYRERYGVVMKPILNVFPLSESPFQKDEQHTPLCTEQQRRGLEPSLYWFSQTIGPGRGLEAIIQAMGKMKTRTRLHLRGHLTPEYQAILQRLAHEAGVSHYLHFLPSAPPAQMIRLAANHDIGLSLEQTKPFNRAICLTNKIFTYLLAGLPVMMSKTPAQEQLALQLGDAAIVIPETPSEIAVILDRWLADSKRLEVCRRTAWELGQTIYNWDSEQTHFLASVESTLL
jgi:glycosyltransferase involved in cell wall biosynthesis